MPQFSVIIPVYNVEPYLDQCIQSVTGQVVRDIEIILIDDGSTDSSGKICDSWQKQDNRIHVIHQNNSGLSAARNAGISVAKGDYLLFVDSDDFWTNDNVLKTISERLQKSNADVLSFDYVRTDGVNLGRGYFSVEKNMPLGLQDEDTLQYIMNHNLWIACACNKAISKRVFTAGDMRFVPGITSEDVDWCLRLALSAKSFDFLAERMYCYRQRNSSITRNVTPERVAGMYRNVETCIQLLSNAENAERVKLLLPYVSYQYGTVLFTASELKDPKERRHAIASVKPSQYLLKYSNNKKIKMLRFASSIGGIGFTIFLLRIRNSIVSQKAK